MKVDKFKIYKFWNAASCGENLLMGGAFTMENYEAQRKTRYDWEPEIISFTKFENYRDKNVLEIGVGLGADHQSWAEAGAVMSGIDLTDRAIELTRHRFDLFGLKSSLKIADAENLPFDDESFDVVYSWGVLLYCPDLGKALEEIHRVLRPGGEVIIMLYHKYSIVGYMLWFRYALMKFRPFISLDEIYHKYLESEGTQTFTQEEAFNFFKNYRSTQIDINLMHGDLLVSAAGQRHEGILLSFMRKIWPRWFIKKYLFSHGLFMKIRAFK